MSGLTEALIPTKSPAPNASNSGGITSALIPTNQPTVTTVKSNGIDFGQIGKSLLSGIQGIGNNISSTIKGLNFSFKPPTVPNPKAIIDSFQDPVRREQANQRGTALVESVINFPSNFVQGFFGEKGAAVERSGGQNFEAKPNVSYTPQNKSQSLGALASKLLDDIVAGQATGINQSFGTATEAASGAIKSSPKIAFIQDTIQKFAGKQFATFMNRLKPLEVTIQDLRDVTAGNGTQEQVRRYAQAMALKDKGLPINEILATAQHSRTGVKTKLYSFIKDSVDTITSNLKKSIRPEEQKLLGSGNIAPGEYTPGNLISTVIDNGIENTSEGKKIIKLALDAQNQNHNIIVDAARNVTEDATTQLSLIREALQSGDVQAAEALYNDLPKDTYSPSFESLKQGITRSGEAQEAQLANEGVQAVKESYGDYQGVVQKMKNFLRISADKKNAEGTLFREHIPANLFGTSSDEIATNLGMSESDLMQKMLGELDIQKQAVPKQIKEVGVTRSQLPVGEGAEKVSRLDARVKKSLENISPQTVDRLGLSTYREMNKKENITKASEFVTKSPSDALRVLTGEIDPLPGVLRNSVYVAMQNLAKGDVDLARKLASLTSTRLGQEISILTEIDRDSPVNLMSDIVAIREQAFKKKFGGRTPAQAREKIVKEIQSKIKKPDKYDWSKFIDSIDTC